MINAKQLRDLIIVPVLDYLYLNSDAAVNLLLGTAAHESKMGTYIKQVGGPALGIFQIEPPTEGLVLTWLMKNKIGIYDRVNHLSFINPIGISKTQLIGNLYYGCAIARCLYLSIAEKLPEADDIMGLATYWKKYYNRGGKGTIMQFVNSYRELVVPGLK